MNGLNFLKNITQLHKGEWTLGVTVEAMAVLQGRDAGDLDQRGEAKVVRMLGF